MSAILEEDSILVRIRRDIAASEGRMAEWNKLFREGEKRRGERMVAPIIALGGIFIGAMGIMLAFFRH